MNREHPWSKETITKLFLGGSVAVVVGLMLVLTGVWAAVASSVAVTVVLVVVGSLIALAGCVAAVASWIGALFNTAKLDDKTWFVSLLAFGIFSCGLLAMVAYVYAGPDGTRGDRRDRSPLVRQEAGVQ